MKKKNPIRCGDGHATHDGHRTRAKRVSVETSTTRPTTGDGDALTGGGTAPTAVAGAILTERTGGIGINRLAEVA